MNVIINGFNGEMLENVVVDIFNNFKISYANIIYLNRHSNKIKAKKIDWLDYEKIFNKKNYPADPNSLIPLDEELINNMSNCERIVLRMINRKEIQRGYSYQDRVDFYHYLLRYWNNIIETKKIDLFISSNVPHEIYDFILYELCKYKKIPTIFLYNEAQPIDTVILLNDWRKSIPSLEKKYRQLQKKYRLLPTSKIVLKENFEEFFDNKTGKKPTNPFYTKRKFRLKMKISILSKLIRNLLKQMTNNPSISFSLLWAVIKKQIKSIFLNIYYQFICEVPNLKTPYVYFALHFQPELTTSPLADAYVDQLLIVQMVSKYLPENVKIYIKEHPSQTALSRSIKFYQDIKSVKNVIFIKKNFNGNQLINNAKAIVTATGTVGWEAMCLKKPILMFGTYTYQFFDGVFKIKTNEDCAKAIKRIFEDKTHPSIKDLKIFLKALEEISISAVSDPTYLEVSKLSEDIIINNLSCALKNEISSLLKIKPLVTSIK